MMDKCVKSLVLIWAIFATIMLFKAVILNENSPWTLYKVRPVNKNTKNILYWNTFFSRPDFGFGFGQNPFKIFNCHVSDCYITNKRNFTSLEKFDAIIFHGPLHNPKNDPVPHRRSPHQIYAYFSMEGPARFPAYNGHNGIFNVTMTYRLDADIPTPYNVLYNNQGDYVAPSFHPAWTSPNHSSEYLKKYFNIYERKSKPVAWFVSNCQSTPNHRMVYVKELQKHITVDIYGNCGPLKCPKNNATMCENMLKNDYFFYLAFENSNCVDYVSEKLFLAITNEVVPVTLNGADMTSFLPQFSYLNARKFSPIQLAQKMKSMMNSSLEYLKYFWWKDVYSTSSSNPIPHPFCTLCEILHDKNRKPKFYDNFVEWFQGSSGNPMCTSNNDFVDCNGGRCTGTNLLNPNV